MQIAFVFSVSVATTGVRAHVVLDKEKNHMSIRIHAAAFCCALVSLAGSAHAQMDLKIRNGGIVKGDVVINNGNLRVDDASVSNVTDSSLDWAAKGSKFTTEDSALTTNPLYQAGSQGENPLYRPELLRIQLASVNAAYIWDDKGGVDMSFTALLLLSDAADPSMTPIFSAQAKGKGTKTPPPPRPISGGTDNDIILGDYRIMFSPDAPFTFEDGSQPAADYALSIGEGSTWNLSVVPAPGSFGLLAAAALGATRRRRATI